MSAPIEVTTVIEARIATLEQENARVRTALENTYDAGFAAGLEAAAEKAMGWAADGGCSCEPCTAVKEAARDIAEEVRALAQEPPRG